MKFPKGYKTRRIITKDSAESLTAGDRVEHTLNGLGTVDTVLVSPPKTAFIRWDDGCSDLINITRIHNPKA